MSDRLLGILGALGFIAFVAFAIVVALTGDPLS